MHSRSKQIAVCYHHFREHVHSGKIKVYPIDNKEKLTDIATKVLAQDLFVHDCNLICGERVSMH